MKIVWKYEDEPEFDASCDLVGHIHGHSVDVTQYGNDTDRWRVLYANVPIAQSIEGRENARAFAAETLATPTLAIAALAAVAWGRN